MTALSVNWIEPHTSELPPIYCATVGVGIGKTEVAIQVIAAHCLNPTGNFKAIYAVPTHKLGDELVARLKEADVTSGVWRGRAADNPAKPGSKMCLKPEAIQKIITLGLPVQKTMCRDANVSSCEHFSYCPYQRQAGDLCDMHVVIVPHESLFYEKPNIGNRNLLVIDESFWAAGLKGL